MSRQEHEEEISHDGRREFKSYEVEVQIPCGIHSEMSSQEAVRAVETASGESTSVTGALDLNL